ncbi:hypothetical protein NQ317_002876 [Molorchus minor]|uniref:Uncharacterized protein n=1 Tax=Molorchus minor TaxID=1323400 RepID=A0ABQ9JRW4_9CUCU|nr:hypothetical protein NQ317_002876 [Molorchus minor]
MHGCHVQNKSNCFMSLCAIVEHSSVMGFSISLLKEVFVKFLLSRRKSDSAELTPLSKAFLLFFMFYIFFTSLSLSGQPYCGSTAPSTWAIVQLGIQGVCTVGNIICHLACGKILSTPARILRSATSPTCNLQTSWGAPPFFPSVGKDLSAILRALLPAVSVPETDR